VKKLTIFSEKVLTLIFNYVIVFVKICIKLVEVFLMKKWSTKDIIILALNLVIKLIIDRCKKDEE